MTLLKGMAPLKINFFIRLLLHDKLCTRNFLVRRNLIDIDLVGYPFCDFDREIVEYLFLHYYET